MSRMWMVRGESGSLYDAFREREVAAVGWSQLAPHATPGIGRKELTGEGGFPKPVPLVGRSVGWVESEVQEWIRGRIAQRDLG